MLPHVLMLLGFSASEVPPPAAATPAHYHDLVGASSQPYVLIGASTERYDLAGPASLLYTLEGCRE